MVCHFFFVDFELIYKINIILLKYVLLIAHIIYYNTYIITLNDREVL